MDEDTTFAAYDKRSEVKLKQYSHGVHEVLLRQGDKGVIYVERRVTPFLGTADEIPDVRIARRVSLKSGLNRGTSHLVYPIEMHKDKYSTTSMRLIYPKLDGDLVEYSQVNTDVERMNGICALSTDDFVKCLLDVSVAVDTLHELGFSHNDIGVGNILFDREDDATVHFYLADFEFAMDLDGKGEKKDRQDYADTVSLLLAGTKLYAPSKMLGSRVMEWQKQSVLVIVEEYYSERIADRIRGFVDSEESFQQFTQDLVSLLQKK